MYEGHWPPVVNSDDATYLKNFIQGYPSSHPCLKVGPSYNLWASADVNGDCQVDVDDLYYLNAYLLGQTPSSSFCPDFEPVWPTPPPVWPPNPPPDWPDCYEDRLVNDTMQSGGAYIAGDCNHNRTPLELGDVVSMIGMYRGIADPDYTYSCPPHGDDFAPEADPNGNCVAFELGDVVTEIGAYRGTAKASGCPDCPGSLRLAPSLREDIMVMPRPKSMVKAGDRRVSE